MNFESRTVGDVAVFNVDTGSLPGGAPSLLDQTRAYIEAGLRKFIFDLGDGKLHGTPDDVGRFLECGAAIRKSGGIIKLSGLAAMQLKLFPIPLISEVFPSIDAALESFARS